MTAGKRAALLTGLVLLAGCDGPYAREQGRAVMLAAPILMGASVVIHGLLLAAWKRAESFNRRNLHPLLVTIVIAAVVFVISDRLQPPEVVASWDKPHQTNYVGSVISLFGVLLGPVITLNLLALNMLTALSSRRTAFTWSFLPGLLLLLVIGVPQALNGAMGGTSYEIIIFAYLLAPVGLIWAAVMYGRALEAASRSQAGPDTDSDTDSGPKP